MDNGNRKNWYKDVAKIALAVFLGGVPALCIGMFVYYSIVGI